MILGGFGTVLLLVLAWPTALGGATTYVVVSGSSMAPTYESGDLVVLRTAPSYAAGDVVAFRTADGDVIHRIVEGDGAAGWRTRGDNVDRVDPYLPTTDDVRGRAVLRVPHVGAWGLRLVQVVPAPVLGALAVLLAVSGGRRERGHRRDPLPPYLRDAAASVVLAAVVLPSALLAWVAPRPSPAGPVASLLGAALPVAVVRTVASVLVAMLVANAVVALRYHRRPVPDVAGPGRSWPRVLDLDAIGDLGDGRRVALVDHLVPATRRVVVVREVSHA